MQTQNTDINAESEISHLCSTQILRKSKWHSDGIISLSGKKNRYLWFYNEFFSTLSYSFPLCLKTKTEEALGMHTLSKFIACLTWLKKKGLIQTPCFYLAFLGSNLIRHGRNTTSAQFRCCAPAVLHSSGLIAIQTSCPRQAKQIHKLCSCVWWGCVLAGRYENGLSLCFGKSWLLFECNPMFESESCFCRAKVEINYS